MLEYKPDLVNSFNTINGFYPLHTAAYSCYVDAANILLQYGAKVSCDTEETELSPHRISVFHIAASKLSNLRTRKIKDRHEIHRRLTNSYDKINGKKSIEKENLETIQENLSFQVGPNCGNNPQSFTPLQSGHIMADYYSKMLSDLSEFILRKRFCETPN